MLCCLEVIFENIKQYTCSYIMIVGIKGSLDKRTRETIKTACRRKRSNSN